MALAASLDREVELDPAEGGPATRNSIRPGDNVLGAPVWLMGASVSPGACGWLQIFDAVPGFVPPCSLFQFYDVSVSPFTNPAPNDGPGSSSI